MLEFSKLQKLRKMEVAKSWSVALVNMGGTVAALGDQDSSPAKVMTTAAEP